MKRKILDSLKILKNAALNFTSNDPIQMAGTTAFFATFSIAPVLIIITSIIGFFTGDAGFRTKLFNELSFLIGSESSNFLENVIENYKIIENSRIGAIFGGIVFLISATTFFSVIQHSTNYIWRVKVKSKIKQNLLKFLKDRVFSFGMILSLGLILLVSFVIDASVSILKDFISDHFNNNFMVLAIVVNNILSIIITATVFTLVFRFLPDVKVKWKASWFGAMISVFLFFVGKYLIGFIIGTSKLGVIYGAASSFVIVLLWIYYVSIIFYFGVETTRQYSKYYNHDNQAQNFTVPFEIKSKK